MIVRKGLIRNGQVVVEEPINLPDGSEVTITGRPYGKFLGEEDNDRPPAPEETTAALAATEQVEPFESSEEARGAWEVERKAREDWEKARFDEHAESCGRSRRIKALCQGRMAMNVVKATWKNGQVVLDHPAAWPEGRRLIVAEEPSAEIQFMTEEDQRDDPDSVQQWIDDVRAIPPLPMTPAQEAELLAWRQKVKEFNLEAVRKQMEEGIR